MRGCIYRTKDNECDRYSEGGKYHASCDDNCDMAVPSNADKIRAMTDEELAEKIVWLVVKAFDQVVHEWKWKVDRDNRIAGTAKDVLDWLKQEANK